MPKWEYEVVEYLQPKPRMDILKYLDVKGAQGWELVSVTALPMHQHTTAMMSKVQYTFKREII